MEHCPIIPYGNKVVIKKLAQEEVTKNGIIIPELAKENAAQEQRKGEIVALNEHSSKYFKLGDIVITGKFSGLKVVENEIEYTILKIDDIHGLVNNQA